MTALPTFLTFEEVLEDHSAVIQRDGGTPGIRDEGLLQSALEQPKSTWEGKFLHRFPFGMATAYGFHLCENHPFVDGNKRTAVLAMFKFLSINGYSFEAEPTELLGVMLRLASRNLTKEDLEEWLTRNSSPREIDR